MILDDLPFTGFDYHFVLIDSEKGLTEEYLEKINEILNPGDRYDNIQSGLSFILLYPKPSLFFPKQTPTEKFHYKI